MPVSVLRVSERAAAMHEELALDHDQESHHNARVNGPDRRATAVGRPAPRATYQ